MYPISNAVKALFDAEQRQVLRITGTDKNEVSISITEADVMGNGFNIDRFSCNGNKLEVGTACSAELTLKLDNRQGQFNNIVFEGAELFVEIGIADWTQTNPTITYIPCGYFTPDEQPRGLSIITIKALDRMIQFDKDLDINFLAFPASISNLINQVCILCDVPFSQSIVSLPNNNYVISALPELQQVITYRDLIQWCAGIMGTNAWIDWTGSLQFSFYGSSSVYTTTTANRFKSDLFEDDLTFTGVKYTNTSGITTISGTSDYALDMTGNYLAASGISTILPAINTAINGYTYRPFSASVINAPYLWPMDKITFTDRNGNDHPCVLTNVNHGINGLTLIAGSGQTDQTNSGTSPSGVTEEQAFLIEKAKQSAIEDVDESLTQEDIFNRLTNNGEAQGIYLYNGKIYIDADYIGANGLSVSDIKAGIIHSADYAVVVIQKIYPESTLFPAISLYPNNGERVTSGFAIDFETGQIYGGFYSEQIATLQTSVTELQAAVTALQNALVYPKAVPSRMATMAFMPIGAKKSNIDNEQEGNK